MWTLLEELKDYNGLWGVEWQYISKIIDYNNKNKIMVQEASDIAWVTLDSTKLYIIDWIIDIWSLSILVPEWWLQIWWLWFNISKITSSEDNHTMFIVDSNWTYSWDLLVSDCAISCTWTNSEVFNLENNENSWAIEFNIVNFESCTSLWSISNYRQMLMNWCGFIFCNNWLELIWLRTGARITTSIIIWGFANATVFKAGLWLVFSWTVYSDINATSLPSTSVLFDFSDSNFTIDRWFQLQWVRVNNSADYVPNIIGSNVKTYFKNNTNIKNTFVWSRYTITASSVTTITAVNTPTKVAWTTTYIDEQHFLSTWINNRLKYISTQNTEFKCLANISISWWNNNQVEVWFRRYNSSDVLQEESPKFRYTLNGWLSWTRAEWATTLWFFRWEEWDYYELWIQNITDNGNITVELWWLVSIEER